MKPTVVLFDIDYTLFDTKNFKDSQLQEYKLYPEVIEVLSFLKKTVKIGIFSEGEIEFQSSKLKKLDLEKYFHHDTIHIFQKKREAIKEVFQKYNTYRIFMVDDKISVLEQVKREFPDVFTIWVKRGYYAENEKNESGFVSDYSIDTLKELPSIII